MIAPLLLALLAGFAGGLLARVDWRALHDAGRWFWQYGSLDGWRATRRLHARLAFENRVCEVLRQVERRMPKHADTPAARISLSQLMRQHPMGRV